VLRRLIEGDVEKQILLFFCRQILAGFGAIAQLGERLPCTQEVRSSILLGSTNSIQFSSARQLLKDSVNQRCNEDWIELVR
jgi:hypothetical protein